MADDRQDLNDARFAAVYQALFIIAKVLSDHEHEERQPEQAARFQLIEAFSYFEKMARRDNKPTDEIALLKKMAERLEKTKAFDLVPEDRRAAGSYELRDNRVFRCELIRDAWDSILFGLHILDGSEPFGWEFADDSLSEANKHLEKAMECVNRFIRPLGLPKISLRVDDSWPEES